MKTLPESPDLDHLRRQAKELLAQLRLSRAETSLSEAQTAVAELYGFRNWPELKAEVTRLRANVETAPREQASAVAEVFNLGEVVSPMRAVRHGGLTKEWALTTSRGAWLVAELFDWADSRYVLAGADLLAAADDAGIPVPRVVRATDGSVIGHAVEKRWRVHVAKEFGPEPMKPVLPATARLVGETLAKLHALRMPTELAMHPWLTRRPTAEQLQQQAARATKMDLRWAPLLADALPTLLDVIEIGEQTPPPSSLIVCHSAFHTSSVRLDHGRLAVVDWDYAGPMSPRWEFGSALYQWCVGHGEHSFDPGTSVNRGAVRALVEGYRSVGGEVDARDLGMFTVAVTASVQWLSSRVNWAIPHEHHRPVEQQRAEAEVPSLLRHPLSRHVLEQVLEEIR